MIFVNRAFAQGMAAFHDGIPLSQCPIDRLTKASRDWEAGWNFALNRKATRTRHEKRPDERPPQATHPSA